MRTRIGSLTLACSLALLVGCGGESTPDLPTDPGSAEPIELVATVVPSCWPAGGRAFRGSTETDEVTVAVLGEGHQGVVLGPQAGQSLCEWADQAQRLVAQGYVVASFTWPDDGAMAVRAAVGALEAVGAIEYALLGASKGGAYAAGMSTVLQPPPLAVIALGPPDRYGIDARFETVRYAGPLLVIATTDDASVDVEASRLVARPDDPDSFVELSGSAHGMALFDGEHAAAVEELIDTFLAAAFGG